MTVLIIVALLLLVLGGVWLLVEMFRVSIWWGIFGILFPPVQWLFIPLNWNEARSPLLLQILAFVLLGFGVFLSPGVDWQGYWNEVSQQSAGALQTMQTKSQLSSVIENPAETVAAEPLQPASGQQTIYKCKSAGGLMTYSDKPCPETSRTLDSIPVNPGAASGSAAPVKSVVSSVKPVVSSIKYVAASEEPIASSFRCDGRTHCSEMTSCAEAKFFLANCPGVKMDNGDGVPCESQWCGDR